MTKRRPRLAVVSPFVDKQHGTERYVAEWLSRLTDTFEIHLYSQHVEGIDVTRIHWHKISKLHGPHIFNYLWWFACNRLRRAWDSHVGGLRPDLIFSPGINCLDADVISVHILFAQIFRGNSTRMRFQERSVSEWLRLLHRRLYYRLIVALERRIYSHPKVELIVMSHRTSDGLQQFYGRRGASPVLYFGLDHQIFNPQRRLQLRETARAQMQLAPHQFALLLVGNDWLNKGLPVLLEAMHSLRELPLQLLVVGQDDSSPYQSIIHANSLDGRIHFLPPQNDVEFYYAASDAYTGPSKEDALPLPPAEAMACGLPVIVTAKCGISELIADGQSGLVMQDPTDADDLAAKIRQLYEDSDLRQRIGEKADETMHQFTWDRSAREFRELLLQSLRKKNPEAAALCEQDA